MIKNKDEKQMAGKERVKPENERENMWGKWMGKRKG